MLFRSIANVKLGAGPQDGDHLAWDETRGDGSYTLRGIPTGIIEVQASIDKYIDETSTVSVQGGAVAHRLDIALDTGATISGRVTDADTGLPVFGVSVNVFNETNGAQQ